MRRRKPITFAKVRRDLHRAGIEPITTQPDAAGVRTVQWVPVLGTLGPKR